VRQFVVLTVVQYRSKVPPLSPPLSLLPCIERTGGKCFEAHIFLTSSPNNWFSDLFCFGPSYVLVAPIYRSHYEHPIKSHDVGARSRRQSHNRFDGRRRAASNLFASYTVWFRPARDNCSEGEVSDPFGESNRTARSQLLAGARKRGTCGRIKISKPRLESTGPIRAWHVHHRRNESSRMAVSHSRDELSRSF